MLALTFSPVGLGETVQGLETVLVGGYIPHNHARLGPIQRVGCIATPRIASPAGTTFTCSIKAANTARLFKIRILLAKHLEFQWIGWLR